MTEVSWNRQLLDQLEWHWEAQLRPRFDGLGDDELLWEPAAGVSSISWRLDHLIGAFAERSASHLSRAPFDEASFPWSRTADGTLALLDAEHATWVAGVRDLGEEGLLRPCGPAEGPFAEVPLAGLVLHIHREVLHHGAEVALLRDLYAAR